MLLPREIHYSYALPSMVKLKKVTVNQNLEEIIMKLESKKYPNIEYEKGEEIFLSPDEANTSFYFDVEEELTSDAEAMAIVANALDEADVLTQKAKEFLKKTLEDEKSKYYETVAYFMKFHRDELEPDAAAELFPVEDPSAISFAEMVDYLKLDRFGSLIDEESNQQAFIMDLSFNPEITDELMVIYFNLEKQIYDVAHES